MGSGFSYGEKGGQAFLIVVIVHMSCLWGDPRVRPLHAIWVHDPDLMGLNRVMSPRKSPFCLRHSYKFFTINDRLSLQSGGTILNSFVSIEQSITELNGLLAGVGYSAVVMGPTFFIGNESYCLASSNIFSAKPCHVVSPAPQK